MIIDPKTIDFKKYKRIFAFGCSFTGYKWPTWVDVIRTQLNEDTEYYNAGRAGAGNSYISTLFSQYDAKYKFNETDLVLVMWSTFMREDRYIKRCWRTPGNIFTQGEYPQEYVDKYADTRGYLVRDMAIIDMTTRAMEHSAAGCYGMLSVPPAYQSILEDDVSDIIRMYSDLIAKFPTPLIEVLGNEWVFGHKYYDPHYDKSSVKKKIADNPEPNFEDYHPNTRDYCKFLEQIGFQMDHRAREYANATVEEYNSYRHVDQMIYVNTANNHKPMEIL